MSVVLDTSAVLAALWGEPGSTRVDEVIGRACISTVNLAEAVAKLIDRGASDADADAVLAALGVAVIPFDRGQAVAAGLLRRATRGRGLSLADRACLALGLAEGLAVVTADRAWAGLDLGVTVEVIR
ncbi:MAG: type II toxin-antitoxin system VapC family toxin [Rhodobacteraceae bacterium]|nr:type II toxin-antitoxin system VapC family toxin [Paracoccaceae bacterium]